MNKKLDVRIKRVYDPPSSDDGFRVLIDRLWPRGLSKERARIDLWCKDCAVSELLRRWFDHDPAKWLEFKKRYSRELKERTELFGHLISAAGGVPRITILFAAKDLEHNNAVVLKELFDQHLAGPGTRA